VRALDGKRKDGGRKDLAEAKAVRDLPAPRVAEEAGAVRR